VGKFTGVKAAGALVRAARARPDAVVFPQFMLRFHQPAAPHRGELPHLADHPQLVRVVGMLDFALGRSPLSLLLLMRPIDSGSRRHGETAAAVAVIALADWYAHVFTLMVAVHAPLDSRAGAALLGERWMEGTRMFAPLLPPWPLTLSRSSNI